MSMQKDGVQIVDERLKHIAFIMDGNGRWANKRGMPREFGHKKGVEVFEEITEYCHKIGVQCVTVYAFSTENWKRPQREVEAIMKLLDEQEAEGKVRALTAQCRFCNSEYTYNEKELLDF